MTECWCKAAHPEHTDDLAVAWTTLWHQVVAELRIPQLVGWLNERLERRRSEATGQGGGEHD